MCSIGGGDSRNGREESIGKFRLIPVWNVTEGTSRLGFGWVWFLDVQRHINVSAYSPSCRSQRLLERELAVRGAETMLQFG